MYPSARNPSYGIFVKKCVDALNVHGHATDVVGLAEQPSLGRKIPAYLGFAMKANWRILIGGYDLVYVHHPLQGLIAISPAILARRQPYVLNFHGDDLLPSTLRGRLFQCCVAHFYRTATAVLVPSAHFKQLFDHHFGNDGLSAKIFSSGGVSDLYYDPQEPPTDTETRGPTALFLSRLVEGKGWRDFIAVAALIHLARPDFRFTIAGTGPDAALIAQEITRQGLADVMTLTGATSQATNRALFRAHRYFIFPTRFNESLALVNLEAMASGCITLSADFPASSEYLATGINGFRISLNGFAEDAARRILALEAAPIETRRAIARKAQATAGRYQERIVMSHLPDLLHA
nr:glycosyltransferase family 4 protein [Sphingosinicella soli]